METHARKTAINVSARRVGRPRRDASTSILNDESAAASDALMRCQRDCASAKCSRINGHTDIQCTQLALHIRRRKIKLALSSMIAATRAVAVCVHCHICVYSLDVLAMLWLQRQRVTSDCTFDGAGFCFFYFYRPLK